MRIFVGLKGINLPGQSQNYQDLNAPPNRINSGYALPRLPVIMKVELRKGRRDRKEEIK